MFDEDDVYKANYARLKAFADEKGYVFNSDLERTNKVVGLMTRNYREFGKYYCPCKQSHPLDTKTDTLCPCPTVDEEIIQEGNCFCKLFFKAD